MNKNVMQIEIDRLMKIVNENQKEIEYYKQKVAYLNKQLCIIKDRLDGQLMGTGRFT